MGAWPGPAGPWDVRQQQVWGGAVCCLLWFSVCTGFFTSVKLNVWPVEEKSHTVQGRCLSKGEPGDSITGAVGEGWALPECPAPSWDAACGSRNCWSWERCLLGAGGMVTGKGTGETLFSHPEFAGLGGEGWFAAALRGGGLLLLWLWGSAMSSHVDADASGWRGGDVSKLPGSNKSCIFRRSLRPNQAELREFP